MNDSQSPSTASRLRTHWPTLAAGMLSQACPSAAPLFHSCAMLLSLSKTKKKQPVQPHK